MNTDDLSEHVARVRHDLEVKKRDLDSLLLQDPEMGMQVRYQIECLEPRLRELERGTLRAVKERDAARSMMVN